MQFCGTIIHLVEPSFGISEDGLTRFSPELVKSGRSIELKAMDTQYVGRPMRSEEAQCLAKDLKIVRWILTSKTVEDVPGQCRARCVAQEIASGISSEPRYFEHHPKHRGTQMFSNHGLAS